MITSTNTKILIDAGVSKLEKVTAYNPNSEDCWLYVYDKAATAQVTVGTTAPKVRMLIPGGSEEQRGAAGENFQPLQFLKGIVVGVETVGGDSPGSPLEINVYFTEQRN